MTREHRDPRQGTRHETRKLPFPEGFLWGTATAAHQVEGNNVNNDWWAFEQKPGTIWHGDHSGLACDWWRNAEADFDLMAGMGHNTHRLSVEWSRIEPEEGTFDPAAIARYREVLTGLRQRGMEPMVTLFHFSSPRWLAQQGGWRNRAAARHFRRFVRHTVEQLGDLVKLWCTINEPNVYAALGYLLGKHAPGEKNPHHCFQVLSHHLQAHAAAYRAIKAMDGNAQVGLVVNIVALEPLDPGNRASVCAAGLVDYFFHELIFRAIGDGKLRIPLST
ncbi:MAG: glycoside hydrolase family 1 protein, partial [Anaerolineae bacterium]|nr:glycoside hydrolase family 1 protein [Anaerolineae bacterium]